jgi:sporulation related protein
MADSNFRAYRGRDAVARDEIDAHAPDAVRDPLAELARLIGQGDPVNEFSRNARRQPVPQYDSPAPAAAAADWPAEEAYADQDQYVEEGYEEPQAVDPYPPARELPRYSRDDARTAPLDSQYSEPEEDYAAPVGHQPEYEDSYRDDQPPVLPRGHRLPALAPQSDDEYENDEEWQDESEERSYAQEDYEDDAESKPRRSGMVLIMAVLGLAIIGVASAFAYRSMFGGVLLPTLPPIIKANEAPNKIVPAQAATAAGADASGAKSGEKLVSREEQPVPIQPQNPPPRVIATIPVAPSQGAAPSGPQSSSSAAPVPAPQSAFPPPPAPAPAAPAPAAGSAEPKKIHTVLIHTDQSGSANSAAAAPAVPPARTSAPAQVAPRPAPAPVTRPAANAPLALVPIAEGRAAPVEPQRTQVARREPSAAPVSTSPAAAAAPTAATASAAGGYAVQVTSQRSEAEAEAAYKSLQAKFPAQLGSHQPIIHRADLGEKGTFYRALVGPFASAEAATGLCSNLKAAGGSCIVQKN